MQYRKYLSGPAVCCIETGCRYDYGYGFGGSYGEDTGTPQVAPRRIEHHINIVSIQDKPQHPREVPGDHAEPGFGRHAAGRYGKDVLHSRSDPGFSRTQILPPLHYSRSPSRCNRSVRIDAGQPGHACRRTRHRTPYRRSPPRPARDQRSRDAVAFCIARRGTDGAMPDRQAQGGESVFRLVHTYGA
ncbi:hypothetical protein DSECCO2_515690 [anaerobic digester metagenome]